MSDERSDKLSRVREHYNKVSDAAMSRMISGERYDQHDHDQARQLKPPSEDANPVKAAKRKPRS